MKREDLEQYVKKFVRCGFEVESTKILSESDDLIIWELTESNFDKYKFPRRVLIISLRSSTNSNNSWITFSPTLNHYFKFNGIVREEFKRVWNSNIENREDQL